MLVAKCVTSLLRPTLGRIVAHATLRGIRGPAGQRPSRSGLWVFLLACILPLHCASRVQAAPPEGDPPAPTETPPPFDVPNGWELFSSHKSVWIFKRTPVTVGGLPLIGTPTVDFVVAACIGGDARVASLSYEPQQGAWPCKQTTVFWEGGLDGNTESSKLKAVVSGTFFEANLFVSPRFPRWSSGISFGLKQNGNILELGARVPGPSRPVENPFPKLELVRLFAWNDNQAVITPYSEQVLSDPQWPNVVGGLDVTCDVAADLHQGRNLVGVRDLDHDGSAELIFFFTTSLASQEQAIRGLNEFACDSAMLLDGSNTAQIIVDGVDHIRYISRPMPHTFAVYGGK